MKILNPKKFWGGALFSEEDIENEINWLQVQPKNNSVFQPVNREYKDVGRAIVTYLQDVYKGKPMFVNSSNTAIDFYKKLGFKPYAEEYPCSMCYEA